MNYFIFPAEVDYIIDTLPDIDSSNIYIRYFIFKKTFIKQLFNRLLFSKRFKFYFIIVKLLSFGFSRKLIVRYIFGHYCFNNNSVAIIYQNSPLNNASLINALKKYLLNTFFALYYTNPIINIESYNNSIQNYDYVINYLGGLGTRKNGFSMGYKKPYADLKTGIKRDLVFIGEDKGRLDELIRLHDFFYENDLEFFFVILGKEKKIRKNIIYLDKMIPYKMVVKLVQESNVILELVQEDQDGNTLRFYESIAYEKKLLTNQALRKLQTIDNKHQIKQLDCLDQELIEFIKNRNVYSFINCNKFNSFKPMKSHFENLLT